MMRNLPVARARGALAVFLLSAAVTAAILLWQDRLIVGGTAHPLTPIFYVLFTHFDYPAAIWMLLALIVAAFIPNRLPVRALLRWMSGHCGILAAAVALVFSASTLLVYRNHPFAMDEYAVFFQSQIFAAGHLSGRFPPALLNWLVPPGFQDFFLDVSHVTGHVASRYWPSFSLLLTPFTWLGIPWACNPVISALTIVAIHRLALLVFEDREAAGLAVLLTIASPVFFADGISYYSMSAHLLANTAYAILLAKPSPRRAFVAGIVGSVALTLHNPVPHLLFAIPWLVWLVWRKGGAKLLVCAVIGYLPLCLILGLGWFLYLSHLTHEGIPVATTAARFSSLRHDLGAFAPPSSAVLFARLIELAKLWLWAVPGMIVLAAAGAWKWRHQHVCRLLCASAITTALGYLFFPSDQGHGWGDRYFHSAWMVLPILAAGALIRRSDVAEQSVLDNPDTRAFVVSCALVFLVAGVGLRAAQIRAIISDDVKQVPTYPGTGRRVVFIDARHLFYGADLVQNDPWLRGNEIRMLSYGPKVDAAIMRRYFPSYHEVSADEHGAVWIASTAPTARNRTAR